MTGRAQPREEVSSKPQGRKRFGVIDPASRPGSVPGWDSFSQLNFLMAAEDRFGVTIPAALVAQIVSIADMVGAIRQLRS